MWIFLNNAMLSVVAHRELPQHLMVRARFRGDIEAAFGQYAIDLVKHTPEADYAYRITVHRGTMARMMADAANTIDYDNFKGSIPNDDLNRHHAYMDVWSVMLGHQNQAEDSEWDSQLQQEGHDQPHS